jgi:hypothetical protein
MSGTGEQILLITEQTELAASARVPDFRLKSLQSCGIYFNLAGPIWERRMYLYHGNALAIAGRITRPVVETIDPPISAALPITGGHAAARSGEFNYRDIVSFRSAHVQVGGSFDPSKGVHSTFATAVVDGLNILDVLTADSVVSRIAAYSFEDGREPSFDFTGSHFEGLRVTGRKIDIRLATDVFHEYDTFSKVVEGYRSGALDSLLFGMPAAKLEKDAITRLEMEFPSISGAVDVAKRAKNRGSSIPSRLWLSAANHLDKHIISDSAVLRTLGGIILIPKFGAIFFAEALVEKGSRRMNLLRVELDAAFLGSLMVGRVDISGSDFSDYASQEVESPESKRVGGETAPRSVQVPASAPSPPRSAQPSAQRPSASDIATRLLDHFGDEKRAYSPIRMESDIADIEDSVHQLHLAALSSKRLLDGAFPCVMMHGTPTPVPVSYLPFGGSSSWWLKTVAEPVRNQILEMCETLFGKVGKIVFEPTSQMKQALQVLLVDFLKVRMQLDSEPRAAAARSLGAAAASPRSGPHFPVVVTSRTSGLQINFSFGFEMNFARTFGSPTSPVNGWLLPGLHRFAGIDSLGRLIVNAGLFRTPPDFNVGLNI